MTYTCEIIYGEFTISGAGETLLAAKQRAYRNLIECFGGAALKDALVVRVLVEFDDPLKADKEFEVEVCFD